ncbi:MAG: levansucrase [Pseudomonadota bacterium]
MVLALDDKWVWDSWYVRDGDRWHAFFLQADKSIGDPEMRHWNVSVGHATSSDLITWDHLGTCFKPAEGPAWDDCTTWTGSVVRGDDAQWHLFYTGTSRADEGKHQKIGHAVSSDLHSWVRVEGGQILDRADPYEEFTPGRWHDRAFRDPWVMRNPDGAGWLMFFTARDNRISEPLSAGAIGFATSPDLFQWQLEMPVFTGGFGELEVPQVFQIGDKWYCLFCTADRFWSETAIKRAGPAARGSHYLMADDPQGPWEIATAPMLDGADPGERYAARILKTEDGPKLLGFLMHDPETNGFSGTITDPEPVVVLPDGRLALADKN